LRECERKEVEGKKEKSRKGRENGGRTKEA
jgi:hypothetical protein